MTFSEPRYAPRAPRARPRVDGRLLRDVMAVVLILCGAVGVVAVSFAVSPLLGAATISVAAIIAGVLLGIDR